MRILQVLLVGLAVGGWPGPVGRADEILRVGAAAVDLVGDDAMVIAGGIHAGKVAGQEGRLRAVATVVQKGDVALAVVACDVLMMGREVLDPAVEAVTAATGIPGTHVLVNCTHTHHAPSTLRIHDYGPDEAFTRQTQGAIVEAVKQAKARVAPARLFFALGEESTVGRNSRQLLDDGMIYWIGPRTNFVRATGPFDPELPVIAFRDPADRWTALWFNHSTHTIGTRAGGRRSPGFYGLAAQDIEAEKGGVVTFLEGASGSTHNLDLSGEECARRIQAAVLATLGRATERPVDRLGARKRLVKFRVRTFNEAAEEEAVNRYCRKYAPGYSEAIARVFRNMRAELASRQGQERETWVQAIRVGDLALVGVPAEYFTQLGLDIKNRSPFRHTYVAELANDWIGYLPNREGHQLGGYQVWTGYHSYAEPGTGERIADEAVSLLRELAR